MIDPGNIFRDSTHRLLDARRHRGAGACQPAHCRQNSHGTEHDLQSMSKCTWRWGVFADFPQTRALRRAREPNRRITIMRIAHITNNQNRQHCRRACTAATTDADAAPEELCAPGIFAPCRWWSTARTRMRTRVPPRATHTPIPHQTAVEPPPVAVASRPPARTLTIQEKRKALLSVPDLKARSIILCNDFRVILICIQRVYFTIFL